MNKLLRNEKIAANESTLIWNQNIFWTRFYHLKCEILMNKRYSLAHSLLLMTRSHWTESRFSQSEQKKPYHHMRCFNTFIFNGFDFAIRFKTWPMHLMIQCDCFRCKHFIQLLNWFALTNSSVLDFLLPEISFNFASYYFCWFLSHFRQITAMCFSYLSWGFSTAKYHRIIVHLTNKHKHTWQRRDPLF